MVELVKPTIKDHVVGYSHNFYQYVDIEGRRVDRLALIREHGILSPMEAKKRNLPFKKNLNISAIGLDEYEDVIFLFPVTDLNRMPHWSGAIAALIDPELPVYSPDDLTRKYGFWPQMSHIYGGEYYAYGCIPPERILKFI